MRRSPYDRFHSWPPCLQEKRQWHRATQLLRPELVSSLGRGTHEDQVFLEYPLQVRPLAVDARHRSCALPALCPDNGHLGPALVAMHQHLVYLGLALCTRFEG